MDPTNRDRLTTMMISSISTIVLACAWGCVGVYVSWTVFENMPSWTWAYEEPTPEWEQLRQLLLLKNKMKEGSHIFYAWDCLQLALWLLPLCAAGLFTCLALAIQQKYYDSSFQTGSLVPMVPAWLCNEYRMVARWLRAQVAPQGFWLKWCNGLTRTEFALWSAWFAVHIISAWDFVRYYEKEFIGWDNIGLHYNVPKSVYRLEWIALSFGWMTYLDLALLFIPVSHTSFLQPLLGLSFTKFVRFHRWLGHFLLWTVTAHGFFYYLYWIANPELNFIQEFFDWGDKSAIAVLPGSIAFAFGILIWVTSFEYVRRNYYEVFYKSHMIGFFGFIVFTMMHFEYMWPILLPGLVLNGADYAIRVIQSQNIAIAKASHIAQDHSIAKIEIPIAQGFSKCPLQDVFLSFPTIDRWQWHPFTILKIDGPSNVMTVLLKNAGDWSKKAIDELHDKAAIPVRITGPISQHMADWRGYDIIVLVAGGVAISPLLSILSNIMSAIQNNEDNMPKKVELLWMSRNLEEFRVLPEDVVATAGKRDTMGWLQITLFYTGDQCNSEPLNPLDNGKPTSSSYSDHSVHTKNFVSVTPASLDSPPSPTSAAHGSSAFLWSLVRPAQPKVLNEVHYLLIFTFACVGAFLGLVLSRGAYEEFYGLDYANGKQWQMGLITMACILVQCIGLPVAMVILPVHYFRYIKDLLGSNGIAVDTETSGNIHNDVYITGNNSTLRFAESGRGVSIVHGRPDMERVLGKVCEGMNDTGAAVFCAGPSKLMVATQLCVAALNCSGKCKGPVDYFQEAYQL